MKYRIIESLLNEYTDHPSEHLLAVVEAGSEAEARKQAQLMFPSNPSIRIVRGQDENV